MSTFPDWLKRLAESTGGVDPLALGTVAVNIILMVLARRILGMFFHEPATSSSSRLRVTIFRSLNLAIILAVLNYTLFMPASEHAAGFRLVATLVMLWWAYLLAHVFSYVIGRRLGRVREIDGVKRVQVYSGGCAK